MQQFLFMIRYFSGYERLKRLLQFEFKWPLDAPPADFDRVNALAQRLRGTAGPT